jgi:hypothetical protein
MKMSAKLLLPILLVFSATIASAQDRCPSIFVSGPAGIVMKGDTAVFSVAEPLDRKQGVAFKWEISRGTIIAGAGTSEITVLANTVEPVTSITATVTVTGLPEGCENSASETAGVAILFHSYPIDEYIRTPYNDERGRLDLALAEMKQKAPNFQFLFVLKAPVKDSNASVAARKRQIEKHVVAFRKFSKARLHFIRRESDDISTAIYILPSDLVESVSAGDPTVP